MNGVFLISIVVGLTLQDVAKKGYSRRVQGGAFSFSAAGTLVAMLFFLLSSGGRLSFLPAFLPYSILFGVSYSLCMVFSLLAVSSGPLSLTALVISCSLILPTLYGLVILHEPASTFLVIGVILLLVALFFIHLEKKDGPRHITLKWVLYAALAFLGNGFCTIIQKAQQLASGGAYKNEFMVVALLLTSVALFGMAAGKERRMLGTHLRRGTPWYLLCGAANGVVNLLVMVLAKEMAASVMFPVISAGGIVMTFLVSVCIYKERLSVWQLIGVLLGAGSVVFLSL